MRRVVKLGGALFQRELDPARIKEMARTLAGAFQEGDRTVLVTGGGATARAYISAARKLGADEATSDLIGIQITRANAELLRISLESEGMLAVTSRELVELPLLLRTNQIAVIGGLQPGQSTNSVAALAAELIRATLLVNATDVDGVYTEDPRKNPKARLMKTVRAEQLLKMALAGEVHAGKYELLDPLAIKTLERSRIPARFVSMLPPENIVEALQGKPIGTLVVYD